MENKQDLRKTLEKQAPPHPRSLGPYHEGELGGPRALAPDTNTLTVFWRGAGAPAPNTRSVYILGSYVRWGREQRCLLIRGGQVEADGGSPTMASRAPVPIGSNQYPLYPAFRRNPFFKGDAHDICHGARHPPMSRHDMTGYTNIKKKRKNGSRRFPDRARHFKRILVLSREILLGVVFD